MRRLNTPYIRLFHTNLSHNLFWSPAWHRVYNRKNLYRLACYPMQSVRASSLLSADFGRGNVQERKCSASLPAEGLAQAGKSALLFPVGRQVCYFLLQKQKKVEHSQLVPTVRVSLTPCAKGVVAQASAEGTNLGSTNKTEHSEEQRSEVEGGLLTLVFIRNSEP